MKSSVNHKRETPKKLLFSQYHNTENLVRGQISVSVSSFCFRNFLALPSCRVRNWSWSIDGCIGRTFRKLCASKKRFVRGPSVFLKLSRNGKLYVNGVSRFFVQKVLSYNTKKFRRETLLCFLVSKNFMDKRECNDFWSKLLCLTVPKVFVERTFWCLWILACAWHSLHWHVLE